MQTTETVTAKGPIRKIDEGIATGEATLVAIMLLLMIFFALLQAILGRLRDAGVGFANDLIEQLHWIDPFLQVCMVWISFLGASLAAHHNKHIGVDVVTRLLPRTIRAVVEGIAKIASGVVSVILALVFWAAVTGFNDPETIDYEYSVMNGAETMHICDAPAELVADAPQGRPAIYCAIRSLLARLGGQSQTPFGASMMIMPLIFLLIGARFIGQGVDRLIHYRRKPKVEPAAEEGDA